MCSGGNEVGLVWRNFNVTVKGKIFKHMRQTDPLESWYFVLVFAEWKPWSKWSNCSSECGEGVRTRTRECNFGTDFQNSSIEIDVSNCVGFREETALCEIKSCEVRFSRVQSLIPATVCVKIGLTTIDFVQVDGGWSEWSAPTACSKKCGIEIDLSYQFRYCNNPTPAFGGKPCEGESQKSTECETKPCPQNGKWSSWSNWTECSVTCGLGERRRFRKCNNPYPMFGGLFCEGTSSETIPCYVQKCPGIS